MPLACASGLYLQGERGSRRENGLRKRGRNLALPIGQQPFLPTWDSRTSTAAQNETSAANVDAHATFAEQKSTLLRCNTSPLAPLGVFLLFPKGFEPTQRSGLQQKV